MPPGELNGHGEVRFLVRQLDLVEGSYKIDVAVHRLNGAPYDYHRQLYTIRIRSGRKDVGIYPSRPSVDVRRRASHSRSGMRTTTSPGPLSAAQAGALAAGIHEKGGRLVFTNGVFDLLHPGHVRYLQDARDLGDRLIVGINSDRSVRSIKGPSRPVTPEQERAEILLALEPVDAVVIFDEETPFELIRRIQPDVLVKGADWGEDAIVGRDVVEARGGKVVRVTLSPGYSTTELIRRTRAR